MTALPNTPNKNIVDKVNEFREDMTSAKLVEKATELLNLQRDINTSNKENLGTLKDMWGSYKDITKTMGYMFTRTDDLRKLTTQLEYDFKQYSAKLHEVTGTQRTDMLNTLAGMKQRKDSYEAELELLGKVNRAGLLPMMYITGNMVALFKKIDKAAYDFRMTMGMTRDSSESIYKITKNLSLELMGIGVTIEAVYKSVMALGTEMGGVGLATEDLVANVSILKSQLGVAEEDSAGFLRNMAAVSNSTMASQQNMAYVAGYMSSAAGVPLPLIMKDIAHMSDVTFSLVSKYPIQIIKAAVEARRLNTSLNDMAKASASLLDFTTSVQNEMEASVLLGRGINLQKARELVYQGKIAESTKEILRISKEMDFSNMDYFQMNAFAKATGRSVEELNKMIQADAEWKNALNSNDPEVMKQVAAIQAMRNASEKTVLSEAEKLRISIKETANQERIAAIQARWHALLSDIAKVFLPIVDKLLWAIQGIMENKILMGALKWGVSLYSGWKTLKLIGLAISSLPALGTVLGLPSLATGLTTVIDKIKAFFAINKVASVVEGKVKETAEGIVESVKDAAEEKAKAAVSGAVDKLSGSSGKAGEVGGLSTSVSRFGSPEMKQASKNLVIVGAALLVFSAGVFVLSKSVDGIGPAIAGMFSMFGVLKLISTLPEKDLAKGAWALVIVGAAFIPFAIGVSKLKGIDWQTMVGAATAIVILGLAAEGFGAAMATGVFEAGVIGIAALGVALLPFGLAAMMAGKGMQMLGVGFTSVVAGFKDLASLSFVGTLIEIYKLLGALSLLSLAIKAMPKIDLTPLEARMMQYQYTNAITVPPAKTTTETNNKSQPVTAITSNDGVALMTEKTGQRLCTLLEALGSDLRSGNIAVHMDGISVATVVAKAIANT